MTSFTLAYIKALLHSHFKDSKKVELWLKSNNPLLGDVSPEYMIALGREHKLVQLIEGLLKENSRD
jgi:hypothetical protein